MSLNPNVPNPIGLPDVYIDNQTAYAGRDIERTHDTLNAQMPLLAGAIGLGVRKGVDGEMLVSAGTGLSLNVNTGVALVGGLGVGMAVGAQLGAPFNYTDVPANRSTSNPLYIYIRNDAGDYTPVGTGGEITRGDTFETRQGRIVNSASATVDGWVLLATVTTSASAILSVTPNPNRFIQSSAPPVATQTTPGIVYAPSYRPPTDPTHPTFAYDVIAQNQTQLIIVTAPSATLAPLQTNLGTGTQQLINSTDSLDGLKTKFAANIASPTSNLTLQNVPKQVTVGNLGSDGGAYNLGGIGSSNRQFYTGPNSQTPQMLAFNGPLSLWQVLSGTGAVLATSTTANLTDPWQNGVTVTESSGGPNWIAALVTAVNSCAGRNLPHFYPVAGSTNATAFQQAVQTGGSLPGDAAGRGNLGEPLVRLNWLEQRFAAFTPKAILSVNGRLPDGNGAVYLPYHVVRLATTGNMALSGLANVDGATPVAGDRVLVWQQTDPTQNGYYAAAVGAWTRTNDPPTSGARISVQEGATNKGKLFKCSTVGAITIGATAITFEDSNAVTTVAGRTGAIVLSSGDIGDFVDAARSAMENATGAPVQALADLRAVAPARRQDKQERFVEDVNAIYAFNAEGTGTDDGDGIIAPTTGTGRWFKTGAGSTTNAATLQGQNGAYYLNRLNHTGTQAGSTVTGLYTASGMTFGTAGRLFGRTVAGTGALAGEEIGVTAPVLLAGGALSVSEFVASGTGAASGLVPSPGTTAGATRYLREDKTWGVPSGGGGISPIAVTQNGHGLSAGAFIKLSGGTYANAQSTTTNADAEVVGRVLATPTPTANTFSYIPFGAVLTDNLSGLTIGANLFLDGTTAGGYTLTDPLTTPLTNAGKVRKVLAIALTATTALFVYDPGVIITPGAQFIQGYSNAFGQDFKTCQIEQLVTITAAATTTTTIAIPAGALVKSVSLRVVTAIPTATSFTIGVTGATTRYGNALTTTAGTTSVSAGTTNPSCYATATNLLITPNATPASATGQVRVVIYYELATAPTS